MFKSHHLAKTSKAISTEKNMIASVFRTSILGTKGKITITRRSVIMACRLITKHIYRQN